MAQDGHGEGCEWSPRSPFGPTFSLGSLISEMTPNHFEGFGGPETNDLWLASSAAAPRTLAELMSLPTALPPANHDSLCIPLRIAVPSLWQLPLCARNQNLPNFLSSLFPMATPTLDSTSLGLRILPSPFVHLVLCVDHAEFYLRVKKDPHSFVSGKWLTANTPLCMTYRRLRKLSLAFPSQEQT